MRRKLAFFDQRNQKKLKERNRLGFPKGLLLPGQWWPQWRLQAAPKFANIPSHVEWRSMMWQQMPFAKSPPAEPAQAPTSADVLDAEAFVGRTKCTPWPISIRCTSQVCGFNCHTDQLKWRIWAPSAAERLRSSERRGYQPCHSGPRPCGQARLQKWGGRTRWRCLLTASEHHYGSQSLLKALAVKARNKVECWQG